MVGVVVNATNENAGGSRVLTDSTHGIDRDGVRTYGDRSCGTLSPLKFIGVANLLKDIGIEGSTSARAASGRLRYILICNRREEHSTGCAGFVKVSTTTETH